MKTRDSDISELQYRVRKALLEPRDKRTVCVDAEVLQRLIDDVNEIARLNEILDMIEEANWESGTLEIDHILEDR